ncbi:MAG: hypothetical protein K9G62_06845 [Alphaproteobacteria bacterium]|nr:hypothetical protein [Alphaproteobacteria bacterium]
MPDPTVVYEFSPDATPLPVSVRKGVWQNRIYLEGVGYEIFEEQFDDESIRRYGQMRMTTMELDPLGLYISRLEMNVHFARAINGDLDLYINRTKVTAENYKDFKSYIDEANREFERRLDLYEGDRDYEDYKARFQSETYENMIGAKSGMRSHFENAQPYESPDQKQDLKFAAMHPRMSF